MDYKVAETPVVAHLAASLPASPSTDIVGRVVKPADGSSLKEGQLIFGAAGVGLVAGGALAEYAVANKNSIAAVPEGVDPILTAGIAVAGITAYQSIMPYVQKDSHVFINGGSGGTGIFGTQFAKAAGCHVTTVCSTANVELCKQLGADEVIDYKQQDVLATLLSGRKYDHIVDNVNQDPNLYLKCHEFTTPKAVFIEVGAEFSLRHTMNMMKARMPRLLGGGKRPIKYLMPVRKSEDLQQIGQWIQEGKVKPIIDSRFAFEDAPKAFEKLKTGRARGKVVVEVEKVAP